jgi:cell division protein FtsB
MIQQYEEQNAEMDRRINMIRTDRDTLEKFAREQFNFAVPGEDVYIVE